MSLLLAAALLVGAVCWWRRSRPRRRAVQRDRAIERALPDLIEMLRLGAHAGLTPTQAVRAAAPTAPSAVAPAFDEVLRRVDLGVRLGDALDALGDLGEPAEPLLAVLRTSAFDGVPMAAALDRAATDARLLRRRRAEEDARRLPVRLLLPLVLCVLPAFGVLTVVPLAASALGTLHLSRLP